MSLLCSVLALHLASSLRQIGLLFVRKLLNISHFQDCLQNAASGAPHGQLSTFELECVFLHQNVASGASNGQFSTFELKMHLSFANFFYEGPLPRPKCCSNGKFSTCELKCVFFANFFNEL